MAEPTTTLKDNAACGTKPAPPCTLVIFGAGGDLTKRLLMPSLYNLAGAGLLPEGFSILGVDHNDGTDEGLRDSLTKTLEAFSKDPTSEFHADHIDPKSWGFIRDRLHYLKGDFEKPETFEAMAQQMSGSAVFYCAVAARFFGTIVDGLGQAGLLKQDGDHFRRVVIEKPFGSDLASARELNARILKQGDESQFYRIDHFLGKETVQSIMAFRFANGLLEPVWRREYIDSVQITAAETVGVEERGKLLRADRCAARHGAEPHVPAALHGRHGAAELLRRRGGALGEGQARRGGAADSPEDAVRGQYTAGTSEGRDVPGLPGRAARGQGLGHRDLHRPEAPHRELALGRRAVLHPHRQAHDRAAHRDRGAVQAGPVQDVRGHAHRRSRTHRDADPDRSRTTGSAPSST